MRIPEFHWGTWEEWDEAYRTAVNRHYFISPRWGTLVHRRYGYPLRLMVFTFADVQMMMPALATHRIRHVLEGWRSMPPWRYGGILSPVPITHERLAAVSARIARLPFLHTLTVKASPDNELRGWESLESGRTYTYTVDLRGGYAAVWDHVFDKEQRRRIRKAEQMGVTIRNDRSAAAIESFYRLYLISLRRWGNADRDPKWYFEAMLSGKDAPEMLVVSWQGEDIAAQIVANNQQDESYALYLVSDQRFWKLNPNNLVVARMLADACERGFRRCDLMGGGNLSGAESFKRTFGAQRLEVPEYWLKGRLPSLKSAVGFPWRNTIRKG